MPKITIACSACEHTEKLDVSADKPLAELACPNCMKLGKLSVAADISVKTPPAKKKTPKADEEVRPTKAKTASDDAETPTEEEQPSQALIPLTALKQVAEDAAKGAAIQTANSVIQQLSKREADFDALVQSEHVPEDIKKEFWQLKINELKMKQQLAIADHFFQSGAFTKDVHNAGQALIKIQAGETIGLSASESMTGLALINGNVSPWGVTLTKQLRKFGWELSYGECDDKQAEVTIKNEKLDKDFTFTAKIAEMPNSKAMGFAPRDKLKWHAISRLCRFYVPETLGGMQYVAEEIEGTQPIGEVAGQKKSSKADQNKKAAEELLAKD